MTTATTQPRFRKIAAGLYGTGIMHSLEGRWEYLWSGCCTDVETCIDRYTCTDGWNVRYVCEHGHFTDILGEWYPTLRDAKADILGTGRA